MLTTRVHLYTWFVTGCTVSLGYKEDLAVTISELPEKSMKKFPFFIVFFTQMTQNQLGEIECNYQGIHRHGYLL